MNITGMNSTALPIMQHTTVYKEIATMSEPLKKETVIKYDSTQSKSKSITDIQ